LILSISFRAAVLFAADLLYHVQADNASHFCADAEFFISFLFQSFFACLIEADRPK